MKKLSPLSKWAVVDGAIEQLSSGDRKAKRILRYFVKWILIIPIKYSLY
ncbi:MAG: hypothetical protein ACI92E_000197 [Oceanicoccus sp.]|jgi:hypothetical protein